MVERTGKAPDEYVHGRLLVIAFHYVPDNTSTGVLRTLKFTKYLGQNGWKCDVITVPEQLYFQTDPTSLDQIPAGVHVYRPWGADIKHLFGVRGRYPSFLGIPDRYWPWVYFAVRQSRRLMNVERFDAIYSTYPVPSALVIGLILKRKSRLPWIVDFRDPWVEDSMGPLRRRLEGALERRVLRNADRIICNTPAMRRSFLQRYPELPPDRFVTITNGYDESDFSGLIPESLPEFEILYLGMIAAGNRNPSPLLKAIEFALEQEWLNRENLRLTFLGSGSYGSDRCFLAEVKSRRLSEIVTVVTERIPYRKALARMVGADVLAVLSEPIGKGRSAVVERRWSHLQVPAKVYEYLRVQKPILALVSGGAVAELLETTGGGIPVAPDDFQQIARVLKGLYEQRGTQFTTRSSVPEVVMQYRRERLGQVFSAVLDELVEVQSKR